MKREVIIGLNGKEVVELMPETEEDVRELERMELAGEIDSTDYFHEPRAQDAKAS